MSILQSPWPLNPGVSQEHNLEARDPFSLQSKRVPSLPLKPLPHEKSPLFATAGKFNVIYDGGIQCCAIRKEKVAWPYD